MARMREHGTSTGSGSRTVFRTFAAVMLAVGCLQGSAARAQATPTKPADPAVTERAIEALVTCEWPAFDRSPEENRALHYELLHLSAEAAENISSGDPLGVSFLNGYSALGIEFEQIYLLGWDVRAASMSWAPRATAAELIALLEKRGHVFKPDGNKVFQGQTSEQPSRNGRIRIAVAAGRHNPVKKLSDEGVTVICSSIVSPEVEAAAHARAVAEMVERARALDEAQAADRAR
ncbi:hypothetical protein [Thauera sp. WH-1]|uniref:hypothetical protein n=1 Tax=Thauera sp. WH-1 TaxID=3398230 RepID=UPI0039FC8781